MRRVGFCKRLSALTDRKDKELEVAAPLAGARERASSGIAHKLAAAGFSPVLKDLLRASDGILDLLPVATFICDASGKILQYNSRAVDIWGRLPRPEEEHGQFTAMCKFYDLNGEPRPRSMIAEVLKTGEPVRNREVIVERADGTRVTVSINIDPLKNARGEMIGAVNCFLDVTERKLIDAALDRSRRDLREHEQRLAATYEHAAIGISETDAEGHFLRVNEAICAITGYSKDELLGIRLGDHTHSADVDPDREAFRKQIAGELGIYSVEKRFIRKDGRVIWLAVRSAPVCDADGHFLYSVRVVQDITERKAAEVRQKLLVDELNHRVKNTLATVQSLASQTARGTPSPADFRERFEGRLIALSKAHDQLTLRHWANADLRDIIGASLAPYMSGGPERLSLRGADVTLKPRAALTLAMTFHELTTNAAKYGALSVPAGKIDIGWEQLPAKGKSPALLRIEWAEQGGPAVVKPKRRGFGSKLIEGSVSTELGGKAALVYDAAGLRCTIELPAEKTVGDERPAHAEG